MVLYCFISHRREDNELQDRVDNRISNMMKKCGIEDYLIVRGGDTVSHDETKKSLYLDCNDTYEGLPDKVASLYEYIARSNFFKAVTHIVKLDEDMVVYDRIPNLVLKKIDYAGKVYKDVGNRKWHIGKCSEDYANNMLPYSGDFVPYCMGGFGYVLSRTSFSNFHQVSDQEFRDHAVNTYCGYEDIFVSQVLKNHSIGPTDISGIMNIYFSSPIHLIEKRSLLSKVKQAFKKLIT